MFYVDGNWKNKEASNKINVSSGKKGGLTRQQNIIMKRFLRIALDSGIVDFDYVDNKYIYDLKFIEEIICTGCNVVLDRG